MISNARKFHDNGYVVVENFLDDNTIKIVSEYLENRIRRGEWQEKNDSTTKYNYYADPLIEVLLTRCHAAVEEATGRELLPTYSYARIYQPGEMLLIHTDRPSCEVSVTVSVAHKGKNSPIWMQYGDSDPNKYVLEPGDAVVYKGQDVLHWRTLLDKDQLVVQFMLHYVDKNGKHSEFAKDKRKSLGYPSALE